MVEFPKIFDQAIAKFSGLETAFQAFAEGLLNNAKFTDWLIAFNLDDIYEGKRPDGTEIQKTPLPWQSSTKYEEQTIQAKKSKGQVYDRVTLKDTGEFFDSAKVNVVGSQQLRIEDTDPKADKVIATWGLVLGVSERNLMQFIQIIKPEFFNFAYEYWS